MRIKNLSLSSLLLQRQLFALPLPFTAISSLTLASLVLVSACDQSSNSSHTKIVGGEASAAADQEALSTVALVKDNFTFCTGTIVGTRQIMSAAHCFAETGATGVSAVFGPNAKSGVAVPVAQAHVHEGYKARATGLPAGTVPSDISLLILQSDIPSGFNIVPVAPASLSIQNGAPVIIAGYGITKTGGKDTGTLRKVTTVMGSIDQTANEFTISDPGKGSCQGDSGGPNYYTSAANIAYVFGVTSRGPDCEKGIGVNTYASKYISWMESKGSFKIKDTSAAEAEVGNSNAAIANSGDSRGQSNDAGEVAPAALAANATLPAAGNAGSNAAGTANTATANSAANTSAGSASGILLKKLLEALGRQGEGQD